MTTVQILQRVRKRLLELSDEIFTDDDLLAYANDTKDDLSKRLLNDGSSRDCSTCRMRHAPCNVEYGIMWSNLQ